MIAAAQAQGFRWDLVVIAFITAVPATIIAVGPWLQARRNHKQVAEQLVPNGGTTLRDSLDRVEETQCELKRVQEQQAGQAIQTAIDDAKWKGSVEQQLGTQTETLEALVQASHHHRREDRPNETERRGST